jgi:hypothetical protein
MRDKHLHTFCVVSKAKKALVCNSQTVEIFMGLICTHVSFYEHMELFIRFKSV